MNNEYDKSSKFMDVSFELLIVGMFSNDFLLLKLLPTVDIEVF
jgi:hypothetical protein